MVKPARVHRKQRSPRVGINVNPFEAILARLMTSDDQLQLIFLHEAVKPTHVEIEDRWVSPSRGVNVCRGDLYAYSFIRDPEAHADAYVGGDSSRVRVRPGTASASGVVL
mgnify:CR=1 FL=1